MLCNAKGITIHYGEKINISLEGAGLATDGVFYIAKAGEAPIISHTFTITDGAADIMIPSEDTKIPLGEYNYSIVIDDLEYPAGKLPKFVVTESAKYTEE